MSFIPRVELPRVKRVKSSMKDSCDINVIMARYAKTGAIDHLAKHGGSYGFVPSLSFHESMNIVRKAEEMLADLPSDARKRFKNSPQLLMEFLDNPDNLAEARKLGLAKAAVPPPVAPVEARVAELEVDAEARLAIARKAVKAAPAA